MEHTEMTDSNTGVTPLLAGAALFGNNRHDGFGRGHDGLAELIQAGQSSGPGNSRI